jgi:hypothetical protein
MNQKIKLTKLVLDAVGIAADDLRVKKTIPTWWVNPRKKEIGGLRLTEQGFHAFQTADIKSYEIRFDEPLFLTNELTIWLDQNMDCPYYLTGKKIWVFGERTAVQLVLFSGDLQKFFRAKKRFANKIE